MTHNRIRTAVNDVLSGASARPTLRYRVLSDIRGEQKVKKKFLKMKIHMMFSFVIKSQMKRKKEPLIVF